MANRCYVNSVAQVSCQAPLSESWLDSPVVYEDKYVRAIEPDAKGLIAPAEARRMSKILKRSVVTAKTALNDASLAMPDAIITGTGMGCMENSEKFLIDICKYGENLLKPTLFMQSTHNTVSSLIAIILKCHGYNNTYSHSEISFESALLDAWLQIKGGSIDNALVGSHDEVTPLMAKIIRRTKPAYELISETSVSAVLSNSEAPHALCEVTDVRLLHNVGEQKLAELLSPDTDRVLLLGANGNKDNYTPYLSLLDKLPYSPCALRYKNIFGDSLSASAAGFYAAATILHRRKIPRRMLLNPDGDAPADFDGITSLNHSHGPSWTMIRLKRT